MIGQLRSLPGQLATLMTRLSAIWAAKLDTLAANFTATIAGRIDAAISSRASATYYTPARAGYLDKLNTGVPGTVKSVQSGYLRFSGYGGATDAFTGQDAIYADVTLGTPVSAVNKTLVIVQGVASTLRVSGVQSNNVGGAVLGRMISTTVLRLSLPDATYSGNGSAYWQVVEYY